MEIPSPGSCSIEGCDSAPFCRGWCTKHYTRWQRHGDPLVTTRQSPLAADATEKRCPRCEKVKPLAAFGKRPRGSLKGYCFDCEAAYDAEYAQTVDGRERRRTARGKWNKQSHDYFLRYRYGITLEDYQRMLATQGGVCAICGTPEPGGRDKVWNVDHCHNSTKVRGLLCGPCNRGLGQFRDDPERLRAAALYLEASQ